jgi:predicted glycosyltransferase
MRREAAHGDGAGRKARVPAPRIRLAFYAHDSFGLGHLVRCLKVGRAIAARLGPIDGLLITGSSWTHLFPPPAGFRYLHLPPVVKAGPDRYVPREPGVAFDRLLHARRERIAEALERFRPDLLAVDNVPCGLAGEIVPALWALKRRTSARLVLMLRDLLDRDDVARSQWAAAGAFDLAEAIYDEIWIFGPHAAPAARVLTPALRRRAAFCGYLGGMPGTSGDPARQGDPAGGPPPGTNGARPRILVTAGGGRDGSLLVNTFLRAIGARRPPVSGRIVLGPDYPGRPPAPDMGPGSLELVPFHADLAVAMAWSDLVVSMAGYHTVCEILATGRPAILVPRVWPRQEQWLRARSLGRGPRAQVIHPDDLTPATLWRAVEAGLEATARSPAPGGGGEAAARRAGALLGADGREG